MHSKRPTATEDAAGQTSHGDHLETVVAPRSAPDSPQRLIDAKAALDRIRANLSTSRKPATISKEIAEDVEVVLGARKVAGNDALVQQLIDVLGRCMDRVDPSQFCRHQQRSAVWGIAELVRTGVHVADEVAGRVLSLIRRTPPHEAEVEAAKLFLGAVDAVARSRPSHPDTFPFVVTALGLCGQTEYRDWVPQIQEAAKACLKESENWLTVVRILAECVPVPPQPVNTPKPTQDVPLPPPGTPDARVAVVAELDALREQVRGRLPELLGALVGCAFEEGAEANRTMKAFTHLAAFCGDQITYQGEKVSLSVSTSKGAKRGTIWLSRGGAQIPSNTEAGNIVPNVTVTAKEQL